MYDKLCHTDPKRVFSIGPAPGGPRADIWAGSADAVSRTHDRWDFVLSLGFDIGSRLGTKLRLNEPAERLRASGVLPPGLLYQPIPPVLHVSWEDHSVPSLPRSWWVKLLETLPKVPAKGDTPQIAIHCQGGHGRTGTALSVLAALGGLIGKRKDPVVWVRRQYCDSAVESSSQLDYVETITGRKVRAKLSKVEILSKYDQEWLGVTSYGSPGQDLRSWPTKGLKGNVAKLVNGPSRPIKGDYVFVEEEDALMQREWELADGTEEWVWDTSLGGWIARVQI